MTLTATAPAVTTPRHLDAQSLDANLLTEWSFAVELDGIAAHEDAASLVAEAARAQGIRPILVQVLSDRREPAAARTRAFGRLAFALGR